MTDKVNHYEIDDKNNERIIVVNPSVQLIDAVYKFEHNQDDGSMLHAVVGGSNSLIGLHKNEFWNAEYDRNHNIVVLWF